MFVSLGTKFMNNDKLFSMLIDINSIEIKRNNLLLFSYSVLELYRLHMN